MVTAGVYILLRISILISFSYYSIFLITIIGTLTCFIGSLLALISIDMKELIAYSTMSQLGYLHMSY
jgi:NADH:ubiquinone oxidoreductase subunit 5 (subunit L)/multisubunit Na+/H+ antiporter MnhA subunit